MNSNEENVFKLPPINSRDQKTEDTEELSNNEVTHNSDTTQSVSKTVLPEPMTSLVPPEGLFFVDQLKNGVIIEQKAVNKSRLVFGRAQDCDVVLCHPSISRYHSVLLWSPFDDKQFQSGQNKESFWYLVDCGSTHGTQCNKTGITAGKLIKIIPNNNVFKMGASTRLFSLGSTLDDDIQVEDTISGPDSQTSVTKPLNEDNGCDWGINDVQIDDISEETGDTKSLQAIIAAMKSTGSEGLQTDNSNAYSSNPNKSIQQWFEREGYDLEFRCDSIHNKFKCIIDLPIDGQWIPVEGSLMHKKKEAISDTCVKCCQLLDRAELLFPWQQKTTSITPKQEDSDSDNDMIDETVNFSNKRIKKESLNDSNVDNFDTLNEKWTQINEDLCKLRIKLANIGLKPEDRVELAEESADPLDNFMASISQQKYGLSMSDKIEKSKLRMKINLLVKEQNKLEKLIKLAKPSLQLESNQQKPNIKESTMSSLTSNKKENNCESNDKNKPKDETIDKKREEIENKTKLIINELKSSSKPLKSVSSKKRLKAQSIVDAIEKEKKLEKSKQNVAFDSDYVDWMPPTNQSGDGKTFLNDKLGY